MDLETAIEFLLDGQAMLFTGSGFSVGATPRLGKEFLTGRGLAKLLYSEAGIATSDDQLNIASRIYSKKFGTDALHDKLTNLFSAESVSENHEKIAMLPWQTIFTTNYDNVLELAANQGGKKLIPLTPRDSVKANILNSKRVVHINGYLPGSNPIDLDESIKLSNYSYLTEAFANSEWGFAFRKSLHYSKVVFFIGYSMYDLDIQRLIFGTGVQAEKIIFIEREGLSDAEVQFGIQSDFGSVLPVGIPAFVEAIEGKSRNYQPKNETETMFGIRQIVAMQQSELRDDRVFDLFLRGQIDQGLLADEITGELSAPYFIVRSGHDQALEAIELGARVVLVSGDMANGKTAFARGLATALSTKGYDIYELDSGVGDPIHDIQNLLKRSGKKVLIIDSLSRNLDIAKHFYLSKNEEDVLICTIKTAFLPLIEVNVRDSFGKHLTSVDLDLLNDTDVIKFSNLMSVYKFWGKRDAWSDFSKQRFIDQDCNCQLSSVLIEVVKSPEIRSKFSSLIDRISRDDVVGHILVTSSVLLLLDFRISDFFLSELMPDDKRFSPINSLAGEALEVLNKNNGEYQFRSSILAKFSLNEHPDHKKLTDQLITIAKNAHNRAGRDAIGGMFFEIYRSLVTFGVLQSLLPEKGKRDALIRFYENVKNFDLAKDHPHFWLQYALARLAYDSADDLDKAKLYLDTAYARARKIDGYHTRHMDNAHARYLVKRSLHITDADEAIRSIRDAHQILIRQARSERNHIPYRVAKLYSSFYSHHKAGLNAEAKAELVRYCTDLIELIPELKIDRIGQVDVENCRKELASVLDDIGMR